MRTAVHGIFTSLLSVIPLWFITFRPSSFSATACALLALTLSACGGGNNNAPTDVATHADLLMSSERGMEGITVDSKAAYIPLYTTKALGSRSCCAPPARWAPAAPGNRSPWQLRAWALTATAVSRERRGCAPRWAPCT